MEFPLKEYEDNDKVGCVYKLVTRGKKKNFF